MALPITYVKCPESMYSIKCPYTMTPKGATVHATYNDASAMNEISYMLTNYNQVSYHFAVDDTRAVQGLPLNRNGWHSGDGLNGQGNRQTIGIETCYSKSGGDRYKKAFDNTLTLVAQLLKTYNWTTDNVFYHNTWSGKYCPHRALDEGIILANFRKLVQNRYNEMYGTTTPAVKPTTNTTTTYKYNLGDTVTINGVYTSSGSTKKLTPAKTQGKITKIATGTKNPYLLDNGNIGWVNEKCITGKVGTTTPQPAPKPTPKPTQTTSTTKYSVGQTVTINGVYGSSSSTQKLTPAVKTGKITKVVPNARNPYLLNDGNIGWVNDSCIVTKPATTPTPTSSIVGKTLCLPASASRWNVYPLSKAPIVGNECGALNPKMFGGLSYKILANPQANVVTISTYNYGKVNIYVGSETGAIIK